MVSKGANAGPERKRKLDQDVNELGKSSNVKVVVRVRPLNTSESTGSQRIVVRPMDDRVVVFDPHEDYDASSFIPNTRARRRSNILEKRVKDLRFIFDRVFDENSTNQEIFAHTTKNVIDNVLNGYNCTVFAYGATGAGKTHTMLGNDKTPGVMFLTMMDLYKKIDEVRTEKTCEVAVSYLEVYNETIRDLLMPGKDLAIREDPQRGVCVSNLTLHQPRSAEELFGMLEFGNRNRSQHPTDANATSSRSHAVFQVFVRQKSAASGLKADFQVAKMSLIDLAGSERATVTKNRGPRMREGANINKSLLALGNCINALAENKKNIHIPYRNSKLTRILKDSLGGNCRTVMIAAVSPSSLSYEDTYNTLKYADRAKGIKSNLFKNVVSVDLHVSRYAKLVKELQEEVNNLKEQLNKFETGEATPLKKRRLDESRREEFEKLKIELKSAYNEKADIRKNILDIECLEKEMMEKLYRKQKNAEWMNILSNDDAKTFKAETKVRKCFSATKSRLQHLKERREKLNEQIDQNRERLQRSLNEVNMVESVNCSINMHSFLAVYEASCNSEQQANELRQEARYYKKCLQNYGLQRRRDKRLIESLLKCVRKQRLVLKSTGMTAFEANDDYENIVNLVEDNRGVAFADQSVTSSGEDLQQLDAKTVNDKDILNNISTPSRTPLGSGRTTCHADLTPRRIRTPSLTLSSTLHAPTKGVITPEKHAPGTYRIERNSSTASCTKSSSAVRMNLMNALNFDGSLSLNENASTNAEVKLVKTGDGSGLNSSAVSFAPSRAPFNKQFQSNPPDGGNNVYPPLREKTNYCNVENLESGGSKSMKLNLMEGNENKRGYRGHVSLSKSVAQKVAGKDMLPKRGINIKESSAGQAKRRRLPQSGSSSGLLNKLDHHKNHMNGVKRAVTVMNTRK